MNISFDFSGLFLQIFLRFEAGPLLRRCRKYDRLKAVNSGRNIMDPVYYTVNNINGDYAYMISDKGVENQVAMFLLPDGVNVGSRLLFENFEWTLL